MLHAIAARGALEGGRTFCKDGIVERKQYNEEEEALVVGEVLIKYALKALNHISSYKTSAKIMISSDEIGWWIGIGQLLLAGEGQSL